MNVSAAQKMEQKSAERVTVQGAAVPKGYKRTELGVIPEDWSVKTIGEMNTFVTSGSRGWATYYSEIGSPFVRITNMTRYEVDLDLEDLKYVKIPEDSSEGTRTALKVGDLLVSITADIGIVSYVDDRLPKPAYINQHIAMVRFNDANAGSKYVAYYLASNEPQKNFKSLTDQGAKAGMSLDTVRKIKFVSPPLPEQQAIAKALSDVDGWVASLDALISKKRDLKTAAMQQLLTGHTRLPGFIGEWETKKLGDAVEIKKGQLITEKTAVHGDIPVIAGGLKPSYYHNQPNRKSNVVTISASGASAGFVGFHPYAIFASDCSTIEQSNAYDVKFIFFALQSRQAEIYKLQTGGAQPHVYPEHIRDLHVALPPTIEEQTAIATILSDMDAEITTLEVERDKASAIKQGMMQELLTGKTRLV